MDAIVIFALVAFLALAGALWFALEHERPFYLRDEPTDLTDSLIHLRRKP